jgi:hypothetical protein
LDQKIRREETLRHTNKKINNELEPATLEDKNAAASKA